MICQQTRSPESVERYRRRNVEHEVGHRTVLATSLDHRLFVSHQRNQVIREGTPMSCMRASPVFYIFP